jgi:PAS domain S-box-containing protein
MSIRNIRDRNIMNILAGFFSGICLSTLFYIVLFISKVLPFTFHNFKGLHSDYPVLFLIDIIPFLFAVGFSVILRNYQKRIDEFAVALNQEKSKITHALQFSKELIHGRFEQSENSRAESNELAVSLSELSEALKRNKDAEALRASEDSKRNWVSEGLAMFGEILRVQEEKMEDLAYKLISNLVKYLKANQSGFFLVEEDEKGNRFIDMIACHAYDRKKFADKRIAWGEGLIGTCALEKKTTYLLDIPDKYLTITSGLGRANPNVLLIVPLLVNNEVQGIIEIASFTKFEDYQVEFIEKVADSIAMTLSNIKNNIRTANLLTETRAQAQELALQEEKMRQNMVELKATQEEAARQAEKFISFTNSVNHTMIRAEYDKEGNLLYANTKFLRKLGYSGNREVEGRHISMFIHEKDREWFNGIWSALAQGGKHFEGYMKHVTKQGQDLWTMATYTNIRRDDGSVERILFLAIDTTEHKKQSLDYEGQIAAINRLNLKAEFTPDGKLLYTNELFNNTLKFNDHEMQQMAVFDFLDPKDLETFNDQWEAVIIGKPFQGQLKFINRYEEEKWFRVSLTAVNDMYDEVAKVVFLANEITNEKIMEMEGRKQNEQLKLQDEKLRLATIELNRKMEEKNLTWTRQKEELKNEAGLYRDILNRNKEIIVSFDNSGLIVFLNKTAENFWKIKLKDAEGRPGLQLFRTLGNVPEGLLSLLDPARVKILEKPFIEFEDENGKTVKVPVKLTTSEFTGKIVYTLSLVI